MPRQNKDLAPSRSLRFPEPIDKLINDLAVMERRTKRAIVAHAVEEYVKVTYPDMLKRRDENGR